MTPLLSPDARTRVACLVLVVATVAVYVNSLACPFAFDDRNDIVENTSLRSLWPIWQVFVQDVAGQRTLHPRPVVNLSLAVNFAMGGLHTLPYHLTNLAIHVLAALALFGLARRTLLLPRLSERYAAAATPLALAIAAIWALHPLQTQAVTYLTQRYESMMGLFYLLAVYCAVRSECSAYAGRWEGGAVLACLMAMGCKEVAVSIPLVILLYDRAFMAGSFGDAWRRRGKMYLGLAGTWLALLLLQWFGPHRRWAGFDLPVSSWEYATSQLGVILHYLRLSIWPYPQVLDYAWPVARSAGEILPGLVVVGGLVAASVWALVRWPEWGTLGACFFLILAPTSSLLPIADLAFEHRMYLPLGAVAATAVLVAYEAQRRWLAWRHPVGWERRAVQVAPVLAVWVASVALGLTAAARNRVYESELSLWSDVVDKAPNNPRAHVGLAAALRSIDRIDDAMAQCRIALDICPLTPRAHVNLGICLRMQGSVEDAIREYREEIRLYPGCAEAYSDLSGILASRGQIEEAARLCRRAVELQPGLADAHNNLANILTAQGRAAEGLFHYRKALEINPAFVDAYANLGDSLRRAGRIEEAILQYHKALEIEPQFADAHANLALALSAQGKADEAIVHCRRALELKPQAADVHANLAVFLAKQGKVDEAIACWQQAIRLDPSMVQVHLMLGIALSAQSKTQQALEHWREVVRVQPRHVFCLSRLAWALATCPTDSVRNGAEALRLAQRAVPLAAAPSPELLDVLAAAYAETGQFAEAVKAASQALQLASSRGETPLTKALRARLALYQARTPFRDIPAPDSK